MSLSSPFQEPNGVNGTTLNFVNSPADDCLPPIPPYVGGSGAGCGGNTAPPGSYLEFLTQLVGVGAYNPTTGEDALIPLATIYNDPSLEFLWTDTFNGCNQGPTCGPGTGTGGISEVSLDNALPADPSTGSGKITIIGETSSSIPEPSSLILIISALMIALFVRIWKTEPIRCKATWTIVHLRSRSHP